MQAETLIPHPNLITEDSLPIVSATFDYMQGFFCIGFIITHPILIPPLFQTILIISS